MFDFSSDEARPRSHRAREPESIRVSQSYISRTSIGRTMRCVAIVVALLCLTACSKSNTSTPSSPDYSGNWSGLQPHSVSQVGTGVLLTISGTTITSATVVTEDYFGSPAQFGCLLAFIASGPMTITGDRFVLPLTLASTPINGISALP